MPRRKYRARRVRAESYNTPHGTITKMDDAPSNQKWFAEFRYGGGADYHATIGAAARSLARGRSG
jgi:hypothetical protein